MSKDKMPEPKMFPPPWKWEAIREQWERAEAAEARVKELEAVLADETEMVESADGPRARRSPYLHWRRRAERAKAENEALRAALDSERVSHAALVAELREALRAQAVRIEPNGYVCFCDTRDHCIDELGCELARRALASGEEEE